MKRLANEYFERVYSQDADPWGFETRRYEERKYALTLAVLPRARYTRAFEPGCSFGVLTELLAPRCDALIASEVVPSVTARARKRLERYAHVDVDVGAIPDVWPGGTFDLVVLRQEHDIVDVNYENVGRARAHGIRDVLRRFLHATRRACGS
ncbi:MAG TPA: SAM-dependent methyltransferase [Polyangiales bacterium]|nr:SAM-dependent methyltransferase [Polyangiales bacterium]